MTQAPPLRARKPTGRVPYPVVLLEGPEKAGKTWSALRLSASPMAGRAYLLDLTEGTGDEYGQIPGVDFEILTPAGAEWTHADIAGQIRAVKEEARRAREAGEPPVVLVIDTMTILWDSLKDWTTWRARQSEAARRKLANDPNADITVPRHLWNATDQRYRQIMNTLLTFPGIVVMTARGREVSATGPDGQPIEGRKAWSVAAQKDLGHDATVWVRMRRDENPTVIAARSVHLGIRPGRDQPQPIRTPAAVGDDGNLLEWLVFTALRCEPATAEVRDLRPVVSGEPARTADGEQPRAAELRDLALDRNATFQGLGGLLARAGTAGLAGELVRNRTGDLVPLGDLIKLRGRELAPGRPDPAAGTPPDQGRRDRPR